MTCIECKRDAKCPLTLLSFFVPKGTTVSAKNSVVCPACESQDIGRGRRPCRSILSISLIILKMCRHGGRHPPIILLKSDINRTLILTITIKKIAR